MVVIEKGKIYVENKTRIKKPVIHRMAELMDADKGAKDYQRAKVYSADASVRLSMSVISSGVIKASPDESIIGAVASYADSVVCDPEFCRSFGKFRCKISLDTRGLRSSGGFGLIVMAMNSKRVSGSDLLHEIAHCISPIDSHPAHGVMFATVFLELMRIAYGVAWAKSLENAYIKHGVKYEKMS
jgi:hypothetical protein